MEESDRDSYSDTQSPIPSSVPENTQENKVDSTVQTDQPGEPETKYVNSVYWHLTLKVQVY